MPDRASPNLKAPIPPEPNSALIPAAGTCNHESNVPTAYSVAQYIAELRAIRATGSATAETSLYPPFASLLNSIGQPLKPADYPSAASGSSLLILQQMPDAGLGALNCPRSLTD